MSWVSFRSGFDMDSVWIRFGYGLDSVWVSGYNLGTVWVGLGIVWVWFGLSLGRFCWSLITNSEGSAWVWVRV